MKVTTLITAAAFIMVSSAQIQIIDPTVGTVWKMGSQGYVRWTGNCVNMGSAGRTVTVDLIQGPAAATRFVASLGTVDCTSTNTSVLLAVPGNIAPGEYALRSNTVPSSYSNLFQINGVPSATTTSSKPTVSETTRSKTSDSNASPGLIGGIVAGVVVVVAIIVFFTLRNRRNKNKNINTNEGEGGGCGDEIKASSEMEVKSTWPPSFMDAQPQAATRGEAQEQQQ
ncbi:hypothetical protein BGZ96_005259, partial [Linnemannia gamsii]